jgi:hypothetical protein
MILIHFVLGQVSICKLSSICLLFNLLICCLLIKDLGKRRNIESVLGTNPILWCCPTRTPGSGLKYELSNSEGELLNLSPWKSRGAHDEDAAFFA